MKISLDYIGRAVVLRPAVFGELFEDACTVSIQSRETVWEEQLDETGEPTGVRYPKQVTLVKQEKLYWYDEDEKGQEVFCAYAGYGPRIQSTLEKRGIELRVRNLCDDGLGTPAFSKLTGVTWRGRQKEIMAKIMAYRGGVIVCPTAYGKTFMINKLAQAWPEARIIVTVTSKDVAQRMYSDLSSQLWNQVGFIGGGKNQVRRVIVCIAKSLHKCPKDANLVLADECHELLTVKFIEKLNAFHRARIFGFTASPVGRSDGADGFAEAIFGPQLINVSYQEGVNVGAIVQLSVRIYQSTEGPDVSNYAVKALADKRSIWLNDARNKLVSSAAREVEEEYPDSQILIMVDTYVHAYALAQYLGDYTVVTGEPDDKRIKELIDLGVIDKDTEICTPKLREKYRKEFESGKLRKAIATKIWKQGVDFQDLQILIRADGLASRIHSCQVPGRLSRLGDKVSKEKGLLIDFMDTFSPDLQGRFMKRLREYRRNGWEIDNRS